MGGIGKHLGGTLGVVPGIAVAVVSVSYVLQYVLRDIAIRRERVSLVLDAVRTLAECACQHTEQSLDALSHLPERLAANARMHVARATETAVHRAAELMLAVCVRNP